ncbi:lysostaphin resistance A-like protein [Maribacter sp. R77961]|uniref:lysostaphin resistance A-like protein n=1 Tax=Maribacter sp. R77961 TaxID=3093871 RepID=UPI0037C6D0CD
MNKLLSNLLIATIATLLYLVVNELIGVWGGIADSIGFDNYLNYYLSIQGALQTLAVLIFIFIIRHRTFENLVKRTSVKWYIIAIALGISFVYLQTPLNWVYNFFFNTEYFISYDLDGLSQQWNVNLISSIIFIPIGEELFFREYIQNNLQKKTNILFAILVASILFALIHAPYMNLFFEEFQHTWHLTYLTFFGGLLSGFLYYKSESIGPSVIFHIFWNLTAYVL